MTDRNDGIGKKLRRPVADRFATWRARRQPAATGFSLQPDPRSIGLVARGRQLISGTFVLGGAMVEAPGQGLWDIPSPGPEFDEARQSFLWLEDLAAVGDLQARHLAQSWTADWMARFGNGKTWTPDLTGQRLLRLISHGQLLIAGVAVSDQAHLFRSLGHQAHYLARRWTAAPRGLPRIEALAGLLYAGLMLEGLDALLAPALAALADEVGHTIDAEGAIPSRNPEELLEICTRLTWIRLALEEAAQPVPAAILEAVARIAPVLRLLRHADGSLARFHGGGRGLEGRLDLALAGSGVRPGPGEGVAMGYARLSGGRTSVILDASAPPEGIWERTAHASTLAIEVTSGRRPLIMSCGSGAPFGADWQRAGRATASHSTLAIEGVSSSRFGRPEELSDRALTLQPRIVAGKDGTCVITGHSGWAATHGLQHLRAVELSHDGRVLVGQDTLAIEGVSSSRFGRPEELSDRALTLQPRILAGKDGTCVITGHSGWAATHGLQHLRAVELSHNGRVLVGQDTLAARDSAMTARLHQLLAQSGKDGLAFSLRFHLHPDVDAQLDLGGTAVSLALRSGELWVFRHTGPGTLSIAPSVCLEKGRLKPRPARQIVLSARIVADQTELGWTLAKAQDTPLAIRDLDRDEPPV